jgi:hypothetical protein
MSDPLGKLTVILTINRQWQKQVSVSKGARQNFDLERSDLRKPDDVEVKEQYQVEISNRFAALENLHESLNMV